MKFIQNKDGSGEWHFSDEEIEIIKKNKKIVMSVSFLKEQMYKLDLDLINK